MAQLIRAISKYPELYNSTLETYRNTKQKTKAWAAVSLQVKMPVNECQRKWKNMRDTFVRKRRIALRKKATGESFQMHWKHYRDMRFIAPFLKEASISSSFKSSRCKSQSTGDLSEEECEREDEWMAPLRGDVEEDEIEDEEGQNIGGRGGDKRSVENSEQAFIIHEIGEEEDRVDSEDYGNSPSPSSPVCISDTTPASQRPGQKRKRGMDSDVDGDSDGSIGIGDDKADEMFLHSLLPYFKRISNKKRSTLKMQIMQLVYEAVFK